MMNDHEIETIKSSIQRHRVEAIRLEAKLESNQVDCNRWRPRPVHIPRNTEVWVESNGEATKGLYGALDEFRSVVGSWVYTHEPEGCSFWPQEDIHLSLESCQRAIDLRNAARNIESARYNVAEAGIVLAALIPVAPLAEHVYAVKALVDCVAILEHAIDKLKGLSDHK